MFKALFDKIKAWGVGHAIDSLDNLEIPLGAKIDTQLDRIRKLNGQELAKWLIDEVQTWLREYFKIPQP